MVQSITALLRLSGIAFIVFLWAFLLQRSSATSSSSSANFSYEPWDYSTINLGPLITRWAEPTTCSQLTADVYPSYTDCWRGFLPNLPAASSCAPPVSTWALYPNGYYSPGLCPQSWYIGSSTELQESGDVVETQAFCCPLGYDYNFGCYSTFASSITASAYWSRPSTSTRTISATPSTVTYEPYVYNFNPSLTAREVVIRWISGDFSPSQLSAQLSPSPATTTNTLTTPSSTSSVTATSSSTQAATTGSARSTKIGLIVGLVLGLLLIICIIGLLYMIFRARGVRENRASESRLEAEDGKEVAMPKTQEVQMAEARFELHGNGYVAELPTAETRRELPDNEHRAELPTAVI